MMTLGRHDTVIIPTAHFWRICTTDNRPTRNILIVPQDVLHNDGLAGFAPTDEYNGAAGANLIQGESPYPKVYPRLFWLCV